MRVKLEDVCERGSSNLKLADVIDKNGDYKIYGASGLIGNVDFYHQDKQYIAVVKDGAGIGRTMLLPAKSSVIGTMQYLLPKYNILPKYLYYVVRHMHLEKFFTGATIPHIYFKDYKNEEFNLCNLSEQKKITCILSNVEQIINDYQTQLSKLDQLVKARFVEMFGNEKQFDLWTCGTIEDIADVCVGVVIKPTQYYTDKEKGIRTFRSLNVGCMYIKDSDWVYFTKGGHEKNQKSIIRENDVLVVRSGNPGTACVATAQYAGSNAVDIIIAHPDLNKMNPVFLAMFTNMPHGMNQINERTGGAAQKHFNVSGYKALTLIVPPLSLQQQFADFVTQVEKVKTKVKESLDKAQTLFDSLMQEYFG